ncbi:hypothetical protein ACHAXR_007543 [Thalassiosira sp. AJA248-18]
MISPPTLPPLLTILIVTLFSSTLLLPHLVSGDAFDDLWTQYMQQTESKKYESTVSRRERNLDHWDVPTAAAYLGLHPETLKPLPRFAALESSSTAAAADDNAASQQQLTDEYIGHDAAILFYAQWCRNCHAVAPSWDAIATHVNAGSKQSNLIMALFDCEKDARHTELCSAAGIKAYPTIMYVGSGEYHDTDLVTGTLLGKDRSAGPFGATTLRRTVKFQGNWQYGDQILDWVSIMKGLSSWHAVTESGPLRSLRNGIFNVITGGKSKKYNRRSVAAMKGKGGSSLPVGVPPNFQTELRGNNMMMMGGGGSGVSAAASAQEVKDLELKLNATTKEKGLYEKAVTHSSHLLDGLLFPKNDVDSHRDPFTILTNSDGWYKNATSLYPTTTTTSAKNDEHPSILRSCTLELTIDYCTRVTTRTTNLYLEELNAIPESDPFPTLEEIEARLMEDIAKVEPYCGLIESCMVGNFEEEGCRPSKCPFENGAACDYVGSCFDPNVQNEYGLALGLIGEGENVMDKDWSDGGGGGSTDGAQQKQGGTTTTATSGDEKGNAGVGGWGVPAN